MNLTLTKDGFRTEGEDIVSVDEIIRDALDAGANVEIEKKVATIYTLIDESVIKEEKMATVITIKP